MAVNAAPLPARAACLSRANPDCSPAGTAPSAPLLVGGPASWVGRVVGVPASWVALVVIRWAPAPCQAPGRTNLNTPSAGAFRPPGPGEVRASAPPLPAAPHARCPQPDHLEHPRVGSRHASSCCPPRRPAAPGAPRGPARSRRVRPGAQARAPGRPAGTSLGGPDSGQVAMRHPLSFLPSLLHFVTGASWDETRHKVHRVTPLSRGLLLGAPRLSGK